MYLFPMHANTLQSCPTLYKPMDYNARDSSVRGILQARILEWVLCPPEGDRPTQGLHPHLLRLLRGQVGSLPPVPPGKLYTSCPSTSLLSFLQTAPILWQPLFPSRVSKHVPLKFLCTWKTSLPYSYSGKRVWLKWQCSKMKSIERVKNCSSDNFEHSANLTYSISSCCRWFATRAQIWVDRKARSSWFHDHVGVQWSGVWACSASFSKEGSFLQKKINNFRKKTWFCLKTPKVYIIKLLSDLQDFPKRMTICTYTLGATEFPELLCRLAERIACTTAWMSWRVSSRSGATNRRPTPIVITR